MKRDAVSKFITGSTAYVYPEKLVTAPPDIKPDKKEIGPVAVTFVDRDLGEVHTADGRLFVLEDYFGEDIAYGGYMLVHRTAAAALPDCMLFPDEAAIKNVVRHSFVANALRHVEWDRIPASELARIYRIVKKY